MYPHPSPIRVFLRTTSTLFLASVLLAFVQLTSATAQTTSPFAQMGGAKRESVSVFLQAALSEDGAPIEDGLVWRVFETVPDADGQLSLVASAEGGSQTMTLPAGTYFINCTFGYASTTRKVSLKNAGETEELSFDLNAGGLVLQATLGDDRPTDPDKLRFAIYSGEGENRNLVLDDIKPDTIVRLRAGTYDIVSTYGSLNAETQARLNVRAGKVIEATLKQKAAVVTLKLVSKSGNEAIADTAWTVLGASGDMLLESKIASPSMILAEGNYTAIARNQQDVYEKSFTVSPGPAQNVELILNLDKATMDDEITD